MTTWLPPRGALWLAAPLLALLSCGVARAALPDPTRPPPGMGAAVTSPGLVFGITSPNPPATPRMPAPAASSATVRAPVSPPRVQALRHSPTDTPPGGASALIDGRLFRVGDRLGETTVQEIRSDGVWLRLPRGGTQWLGLYAPAEVPATTTESATGVNSVRKEP